MSKWIKKLTEAYSEVNENTKMANAKALAKATASSEKGKAAVTLPKAPFDIPKKVEKMPIAKKDVNELNKSTLGSYIKKAHKDGPSQAKSERGLRDMGAEPAADKAAKRAKNRAAGIATAADKLAKEAMDPVNHKALKGKHKDRDDTDIDNDGDTDSTDKYLHKRRKAISKNIKGGDEVEMNPKKKKDKGASTANADAEMAESTMPSVYARILEARKHNDKANPGSPAGEGMSPTAKKAKADMEAGAKMDDTEEKGHVDAAKAGRAGPGRKPRRNDNMKGDKSVIPSATKMKEAFAAVYESEDSKVTSSIEKKDPDAMHMSTHGSQHVYIGGQSDRENHSYHVHDTSTGKTHHVSLDHGGKAMSHGAVKSAAGSKVSSAAVKAIHSDHTDELS